MRPPWRESSARLPTGWGTSVQRNYHKSYGTCHSLFFVFCFFFKFLEDICPFLWGHWYPCFGILVMSAQDLNTRVDSPTCMLCCPCTMDCSDSPLVWHLLTSWWPAWQLSHFNPRTCEQALVGSSVLLPHSMRQNADWPVSAWLVIVVVNIWLILMKYEGFSSGRCPWMSELYLFAGHWVNQTISVQQMKMWRWRNTVSFSIVTWFLKWFGSWISKGRTSIWWISASSLLWRNFLLSLLWRSFAVLLLWRSFRFHCCNVTSGFTAVT